MNDALIFIIGFGLIPVIFILIGVVSIVKYRRNMRIINAVNSDETKMVTAKLIEYRRQDYRKQ